MALVFYLVWWIVNGYRLLSWRGEILFQNVTFMIWPTSIMMIGDLPSPDGEFVFLLSAVANTILYGIVGALIWYGLARCRAALILPPIIIAAIWWRIFTL